MAPYIYLIHGICAATIALTVVWFYRRQDAREELAHSWMSPGEYESILQSELASLRSDVMREVGFNQSLLLAIAVVNGTTPDDVLKWGTIEAFNASQEKPTTPPRQYDLAPAQEAAASPAFQL